MDKKSLRNQAKEFVRELDDGVQKEINEKLEEHLTASDLWKAAHRIGITISGANEWDTEPIIRKGWAEGKEIVVPKCIPETKGLDFYKLESYDQLEESFFQLLEPNPVQTTKVKKNSLDLLIVPGLLYDKRGFRIGFGGGYYDRYLADFAKPTVSILYSKQLVDHIPSEPYDIAVKHLITEHGFIK